MEYTVVLLVDDMVDLQEINFHLLLELVGNACGADVRCTWLGPLAAHWAGLNHIRDIVDSGLGDSHLF